MELEISAGFQVDKMYIGRHGFYVFLHYRRQIDYPRN